MKLSLVILVFQLAILAVNYGTCWMIKRLHPPPPEPRKTLACQAMAPETAQSPPAGIAELATDAEFLRWRVTVSFQPLNAQLLHTKVLTVYAVEPKDAIRQVHKLIRDKFGVAVDGVEAVRRA